MKLFITLNSLIPVSFKLGSKSDVDPLLIICTHAHGPANRSICSCFHNYINLNITTYVGDCIPCFVILTFIMKTGMITHEGKIFRFTELIPITPFTGMSSIHFQSDFAK